MKGRTVKPQILILSIRSGAEKNLLFLPEIEPRFLGCANRSPFSIATVYAVTKTENQFAVTHTHTHTHTHLVGLLRTRDRHVAELYLTTHDTHKRKTSIPPAGFEPAIPASEWL